MCSWSLTLVLLPYFNINQMSTGKQKIPQTNNERLSLIMNDINKAYTNAANVFHAHFKQIFDTSLRTDLMVKEKYIKSLYRPDDLYEFIDAAVRYRIGVTTIEPPKNKFIYSMTDPYMITESLDDILHRIMYSAYPANVIKEFKNYLDGYIYDERIVDLIVSKLEIAVE